MPSPSSSPSSFPSFFQALWGYPPFDWQTRLLERVHERGWPSTLDLPTGSGKTATLDVALFALALDASLPVEDRRQSRRIVLVVDRRVVVDQAFQRAVLMAKKLDEAEDGILHEVASALRSLSGSEGGLPILPAILRGGMPRESEWAKSPSQPLILISTVDQVGSRLLFRGYGVSERMRSVHAGLLGRDTLLLLDEVHLARPFEETLSALTKWYGGSQSATTGLPQPLVFVRMSATVAEAQDDTFGLEQTDRDNVYLRARLSARKHAVLRQVNTPKDSVKAGDAIAKAAAREVERLSKGPPRAVAVIVNRVDTARKVALLARERLPNDWSVSLLTGRMRPLDRLERQTAVLDQVAAGRKRSENSPKLLLVSTQAIEAGADFDFDALVTECASLDALRQRFGRLDRLGDVGLTEAVILAGSGSVDEKADADPIYGHALRETWQWLRRIGEMSAEQDTTIVDFSIDALGTRLSELDPKTFSSLVAPRAVAPVLTSSHLDRWVQTSPAPSADPDVAPFLHGTGRGTPEVLLVWRADVHPSMLTPTGVNALRDMLEAVRPSSLEALSVPLWTAKRWLELVAARRAKSDTTDLDAGQVAALVDVEGAPDVGGASEREIAPVLAWRGGSAEVIARGDDLWPGATLVVPSSYGGLDPIFDCWDPESQSSVRDRGDEAQLLQRGRAVLRWSPMVLAAWTRELPAELTRGPRLEQDDLEDRGPRAEREAFLQWRTDLLAQPTLPSWMRMALDALDRGILTTALEIPVTDELHDKPAVWRVTVQPRAIPAKKLRKLFDLPEFRDATPILTSSGEASTEDDEGSFLGNAVTLSRHLEGVRDFAHSFSEALHLPDHLVDDLALAGWIHDLGKADPRFQLLLHGGDPVREAAAKKPLAKSSVPATDRAARERARVRSGYPTGMRHELMSVALVEQDENLRSRARDWELVLHLVASHHGWCRPFAPPVEDSSPVPVSVTLDSTTYSASSAHELQRFDSSVPTRFWSLVRRYGYWGLAWLEAILRLADHRESERESLEEETHD